MNKKDVTDSLSPFKAYHSPFYAKETVTPMRRTITMRCVESIRGNLEWQHYL